jgi:hypothetical protein|tara:strand:+ start:400 stop:717 length:318 start_codon:yes stop_codon:yes gene_type:complete
MTKVDVWKNNVLTVRDMTTSEQSEWDSHNTAEAITAKKLGWIKEIRLQKLQETDWWVLRGTMTDAQKEYRQKLRDIPANYDSSKYDALLAIDSNENLTHSVWSKP